MNNGDEKVTLRDYFAGCALQGMLASDAHPDVNLVSLMDTERKIAERVKFAYELANAMVKERENW